MTAREVQPDPVVRTALQLLPVPEHHEHFWTELEARLDAVPLAGARSEPTRVAPQPRRGAEPAPVPRPLATPAPSRALDRGPDPSLAVVPPALRRRSNLVLSAVAMAAAVMVVVAGGTLVRQRSVSELTADPASESEERATLASSSSAPEPTLARAAADASVQAVQAWVAAIAAGDTQGAWAALGDASRAHFGSQAAFAAEQSALAEGYGAWAGVDPDDVVVTELGRRGDATLVVVTFAGTITQEGSRQRRAEAFPVRIEGGSARIETFAFAGELEFLVPGPAGSGGSVRGDDELSVVVPRDIEAPTIRLDDGEVLVCGEDEGTELTELADAPGQRCDFQPEGGIRPGRRVLTVAFLAPNGDGVAAESVLFEAA